MVLPALVAGEAHGMPVIVRGIMHGSDVGKTDAADDESAKQKRGEDRDDARKGDGRGLGAASGFCR